MSEWIPCKYEFPDEGTDVLVTGRSGGEKVVGIDRYRRNEETGMRCWQKMHDVIAWRPLPEAYEEDAHETQRNYWL